MSVARTITNLGRLVLLSVALMDAQLPLHHAHSQAAQVSTVHCPLTTLTLPAAPHRLPGLRHLGSCSPGKRQMEHQNIDPWWGWALAVVGASTYVPYVPCLLEPSGASLRCRLPSVSCSVQDPERRAFA